MVALINTNRKMYLAPVSIAITTMMMPNIWVGIDTMFTIETLARIPALHRL